MNELAARCGQQVRPMRLEKDKSILDLMARLDLPSRDWIVVDHWDADLCAIGIAHREEPRRLVYISTFDQEPGSYYYECEVPAGPNEIHYEATRMVERARFDELLEAMETHLDAGPRSRDSWR